MQREESVEKRESGGVLQRGERVEVMVQRREREGGGGLVHIGQNLGEVGTA